MVDICLPFALRLWLNALSGNQDDNRDLLAEYNHDAPPAGSDSEAEEDNTGNFREDDLPQESAMNAVSNPSPPPSPTPCLCSGQVVVLFIWCGLVVVSLVIFHSVQLVPECECVCGVCVSHEVLPVFCFSLLCASGFTKDLLLCAAWSAN